MSSAAQPSIAEGAEHHTASQQTTLALWGAGQPDHHAPRIQGLPNRRPRWTTQLSLLQWRAIVGAGEPGDLLAIRREGHDTRVSLTHCPVCGRPFGDGVRPPGHLASADHDLAAFGLPPLGDRGGSDGGDS